MARKTRRNWALTLILLVLAAAAAGYVVGLPSIRVSAPSADRFTPPLADQIRFRTFELLLFAWLFLFGASLGSFLNVVIYRVPRRLSLWGSSRCPYCRVGIRPRDNIPVFAWFALRGRCRVCRLPISVRYPLVEFTVGMLILILGTLEVLRAGANLPAALGDVGPAANITWLIHRPNWDLVLACILHGLLLCILFSWAFIQYDGYAVPRGYLVLAVVLIPAIPLVRPSVQPIPAWTEIPVTWHTWPWFDERIHVLAGLVIGLFAGGTLALAERWTSPRISGTRQRSVACGLIGTALGWQAVISVCLMTAVLRLLGLRATRRWAKSRSCFLAYLFLATTVQVFFWNRFERFAWWPNSHAGAIAIAVATLGAILLGCLASVLEDEASG